MSLSTKDRYEDALDSLERQKMWIRYETTLGGKSKLNTKYLRDVLDTCDKRIAEIAVLKKQLREEEKQLPKT